MDSTSEVEPICLNINEENETLVTATTTKALEPYYRIFHENQNYKTRFQF
jgi:hypothetical protein